MSCSKSDSCLNSGKLCSSCRRNQSLQDHFESARATGIYSTNSWWEAFYRLCRKYPGTVRLTDKEGRKHRHETRARFGINDGLWTVSASLLMPDTTRVVASSGGSIEVDAPTKEKLSEIRETIHGT